jgi:hypothetical protein
MKLAAAIGKALFPQETDRWVAILRIGLGLQLLTYLLALRQPWHQLLATTGAGLIGREVSEAFVKVQSPLIPTVGWLISSGEVIGLSETAVLRLSWIALTIAAVLLIAGLLTRVAAVTCWFLHLCAAKSGALASYGVDNMMTIALFYLSLAPLPDRYALDYYLRRDRPTAEWLGLFRRILQLHLCIIYLFGGLTKALGSGWWNGENLWTALTRPPFDVLPAEVIARFSSALPALGISVWLLELTYPLFIWPQKTRLACLTLICLMHFGIGVGMGMHLFAIVMIVLNVAAFGAPSGGSLPMGSVAPDARQ